MESTGYIYEGTLFVDHSEDDFYAVIDEEPVVLTDYWLRSYTTETGDTRYDAGVEWSDVDGCGTLHERKFLSESAAADWANALLEPFVVSATDLSEPLRVASDR